MILKSGAAAIGLGLAGCASEKSCWSETKTKRVLFFSKSSGFEHSVIKTPGGEPGFAQKLLAKWGPDQGIEFTFSKDGSLFNKEYCAGFDAFFFYTTGDLTTVGTDKNPAMSPEGKQALLDAVHGGKGFVGSHCAADTFHTSSKAGKPPADADKFKNFGAQADPYIRMLGGEFISHGKQQPSAVKIVDPDFPGFGGAGSGFNMTEEWYSLKDFGCDLHVILMMGTEGMEGWQYQRAPYPSTWARMHGRGRVFYTSMGHRDDVWENPMFQKMLFGGIHWSVRNVEGHVKPNIEKVAPHCLELPRDPKFKG